MAVIFTSNSVLQTSSFIRKFPPTSLMAPISIQKVPNCVNCIFYSKCTHICARVFIKVHPKIETFHYPKTITARKHDYLCGIGGKYFADKKLANNCNNSHIMG